MSRSASSTILRFSLLALPLALTACGEGWEAVRSDQIFPYGNQRTAGTGVMYVRANMMPEKEMKLEPVSEAHAPETVKGMDATFKEEQSK